MNFDEAFAHYKEGVATQEEKDFIKAQLAIANEMVADDEKRNAAPVMEASDDDVKKAKKKFKWQYIVIPALSIVVVLAVVAAILGGVFGSAASYAKQSATVSSKAECEIIACQKAKELADAGLILAPKTEFEVDDIDREFNYVAHDIKKSYYSYYVTLEYDAIVPNTSAIKEVKVVIEVNTVSGEASLVKVKNK